jgi:hypothetical protein
MVLAETAAGEGGCAGRWGFNLGIFIAVRNKPARRFGADSES